MKGFSKGFIVLCLLLAAAGCGKGSRLEGRVVDENGKPIPELTIIADPVGQVKGYDQVKAETDSDGTFLLKKLCPDAFYVLTPKLAPTAAAPMWSVSYGNQTESMILGRDGWFGEARLKARAGEDGKTVPLPGTIVIRPALSFLTGKVADGKGAPLAGKKVSARPVKNLPGYGVRETSTGEDGSFELGMLLPGSVYEVSVDPDNPAPGSETRVRTAPVGETLDLLVVLRLFKKADGVVLDSKTRLEWIACPQEGLSWDKAKSWAESLKTGGGRWGLPSRKELSELQKTGVGAPNQKAPVLFLKRWDVWTGESDGSAAAPTVNVSSGYEAWCRFPLQNGVLAVRPAK